VHAALTMPPAAARARHWVPHRTGPDRTSPFFLSILIFFY
jgi:hypothetical protein